MSVKAAMRAWVCAALAALGCERAPSVEPPAATTAAATATATTTATTPAPGTAAPTTSATASAVSELGPQGKILCFGDSITQADWPGKIAPDEKWVTVLQKKSARIAAVNAGKNGRTTTAGLAELPKALEQHADSTVVLFFLGVNDMKHGRPGVVEKATANMGKMIDLTREKLPRADVWVFAPINVNVDKLSPYFKQVEMGPDTAHYMKALSVAYADLARKKGVRFASLLDVVAPTDLEDGVHANGRGQAKIAEAVWSALEAGTR